MYGCAALSLACKYYEYVIPVLDNYLYITNKAFEEEELKKAEQEILLILGGKLHLPIYHQLLEVFTDDTNILKIFEYLLGLFTISNWYTEFLPSVVTSSIYKFLCELYFIDEFKNILNIDEKFFRIITRIIMDVINNSEDNWFINKLYDTERENIKRKILTYDTMLFDSLPDFQELTNTENVNTFVVDVDKYVKWERLYERGLTTIYKIKTTEDDETLVYKMIKPLQSEGISCSYIREVSALNLLNHKNIIKIKAITEKGYIMECMPVLLQDYLNTNTVIEENITYSITLQLFRGLNYIHNWNIIHADIKPENILLSITNNDILVKYADFGSMIMNFNKLSFVNLYNMENYQLYHAPELLVYNGYYDERIDIWAIGIIIYKLITKNLSSSLHSCKLQMISNTDINRMLSRFGLLDSDLKTIVQNVLLYKNIESGVDSIIPINETESKHNTLLENVIRRCLVTEVTKEKLLSERAFSKELLQLFGV
jgi:serine/threonine protein kinase